MASALSASAIAGVNYRCLAGSFTGGLECKRIKVKKRAARSSFFGRTTGHVGYSLHQRHSTQLQLGLEKLIVRKARGKHHRRRRKKVRQITVAGLDEKPSTSSKQVASIVNSEGIDEELASKIKSGEFTAASPAADRKNRLGGVRKTLASRGDFGRYLALLLARFDKNLRSDAQKKMPEATGDVRRIVGQPFFVPLYALFKTYGGIFRLSFGPKSFIIISDPDFTRRILKDNAKSYSKGILAEILEFVMGKGLIPADGEIWKTRRRAVVPSLHKRLCEKLNEAANDGHDVEMESLFSHLTLDIIGKAVFNYDFDSLSNDTGIVEAVYVTLREAEDRSVGIIPYWNIPILAAIDPRQRRVAKALKLVNDTLDSLIDKCKRIVEEEAEEFTEEYLNERDPSILHFLLASGDEVTSKQLRDDLMTLLIAGHETSAAVLTWTTYLLSQNPAVTLKLQREVDSVLGDRAPTLEDMKKLTYTANIVYESMRLYPQPPVLIRRPLEDDMLGQYVLKKGEDIFISVWNLHRSPDLWEDPDDFKPERWESYSAAEASQAFRYIPFGGGPRKCVGDVFATYEVITALAMLARRFNFEISPGAPDVLMTTGATIHTTNGLQMTVTHRTRSPVIPVTDAPSLTTVDENGVIKTYSGSDGSVSVVSSPDGAVSIPPVPQPSPF